LELNLIKKKIIIRKNRKQIPFKINVTMFKAPFSFKGRIRRTEFGITYII